MQSAEAADHMKRANEEDVFDSASGPPDKGESLTRPAVETQGTLETAASSVKTVDV